MPIKSDVILTVSLVAAMLLAVPAVAQTAPPPAGAAPAAGATPAAPASDPGAPGPAAAPALESPALGPLSGRDTPIVVRPPAGGVLSGFATIAPSLGAAGVGAPFDLGNRSFGIRPSIGMEVLGTNTRLQTSRGARSNIVTTIAPSLEAAVDTVRLSGVLRYTPALRIYGTHLNGVDQVGDGRLLAALFPGLFYLDIRGAASVLPVTAGQIPGSGQVIARDNTVQTYTAQVTPYVVQRFGSLASFQGGYSFQYSRQNGDDFTQSGLDGSSANYVGHRGFAVLRSGEDLGRLALQGRVDGTRYVGDGIYDGAQHLVAAVEARYAILRNVAVFGEIGYEKQKYAGTNPLDIKGVIWSVGGRLTPTPESIVIIRYGRQNGFNSFSLNAGVALGVRTNLFATYQETIGTSLSQAQDLLATATTDDRGNLVDSQSGAPVVQFNSFLGQSDTLYRSRLGTVSLRYQWPRDVFTLSGTYQSQDPVTSANTNVPAVSSRGAYATFSWAHDFSRRTTGQATAQYGRFTAVQPGRVYEEVYSASAMLFHELSEKLTGSLQFSWARDTILEANPGDQFAVRAGLRRTF